ncbi:hypothetical protein KQY27_09055 [Methanobrevibacter sp. TMH8]|uniref:DUF5750 family protein n=1 Tax=Methanobrevibacter sp. TMH8 TaxID=2848611 RepID=UPI001CCF33EE|nr:DUF5750 family protein [Methanobrevibacter sp. TMH8]MBZ9571693.1 hypothetical protein [Methanobrevibacter sp. TMH8]
MKVKVKDYGSAEKLDSEDKEMSFVTYEVSGLDSDSLEFLKENLEGKIDISDDLLYITIFYDEEMSPFHTDEAKAKIDDFIAREEIEMTVFLSSFLEDKNE